MLYCRDRNIGFEQVVGFAMREEDYERLQMARARLPENEQARIELELAQVHDMGRPQVVAQLIAALPESDLPIVLMPLTIARR